MYDVVADVERYPEFVPYCTETAIVDEVDGERRVNLKVGVMGLDETFQSTVTTSPERVVSTAKETSMFKELYSAWHIRAVTPQQCMAELRLRYKFNNAVYNQLAQRLGPKVSTQMIEAFTSRARALQRADTKHD